MPKPNLLGLSTELQSSLIAKLAVGCDLPELLDQVTEKTGSESDVLRADACSIYTLDDRAGSSPRIATMQAGSGYQKHFVNVAQARVMRADMVSERPTDGERLGVTGWVISTGRAVLARNAKELQEHPHWSGGFDGLQLPRGQGRVGTFLAVPLRNLRGQVIGAFKAERLEPCTAFSVEDQLVLETLARVAGRCIDYREMLQSGSLDTAITLWAREVIAEALATEGELDAFLDIVVGVVAKAMQADSGAIFLVDESKKTLTQRAGCGSHVLRKVIRSYVMPDRSQVERCLGYQTCSPRSCKMREPLEEGQKVGLTAWVAATGKSFHAKNMADLKTHCHHRGEYDEANFTRDEQCGAWLGVPLRVGGAVTGVLKVENVSRRSRPDDRDFDDQQQRRLAILAQEVALAIERLQMQYRARYQVIVRAMPTILGLVKGELPVPKLVTTVVEETQKLFNARACALFLKQGDELVQPPWAAVGYAKAGPKQSSDDKLPHSASNGRVVSENTRLAPVVNSSARSEVRRYQLVAEREIADNPAPQQKVGLTVWIAVKRKSFAAKSNLELTAHPHHKGTYDRDNFTGDERCESFMGIPLLAGGELIGVLKVETKMRGADFAYFNEQDELAFELIANSAAIAIQNALLLEARRLADRVLTSPNNDEVLRVLHEFVGDREEAIDTIRNAANNVAASDATKAPTVRSFAELLHPGFTAGILEQLAGSLQPPLKDLLDTLVAAIHVEDLEGIRTLLAPQRLNIAEVVQPRFLLHKSGATLIELMGKLGPQLDVYRRDPCRRAALAESKLILERTAETVEKMNLFERTLLKRVVGQWLEIVEKALSAFHPVMIPYVAGVPLRAESPVFFGRREVFDWIHEKLCLSAPAQKNTLVLHGGARIGKTSILLQLEEGRFGARVREGATFPTFPVFVDLLKIKDPGTDNFFLGIADAMRASLRKRGVQSSPPDTVAFREAPFRAFDGFLAGMIQPLHSERGALLVLMLDEFELLYERVREGHVDAAVFDYLRSLMQGQQGVTFILAGHRTLDEIEPKYRTPLFNVALHKEIGFLAPDDATCLICEPVRESGVTYQEAVVRRLLRLTGGQPYLLQQLCTICLERINSEKRGYVITEEHLDRAVETALHPGVSEHLSDMWRDLGEEAAALLRTLARLVKGPSWSVAAGALRKAAVPEILVPEAFAAAMKKLTTHGLVVARPSVPERDLEYSFGVDLMRELALRQPY